ncbi:hypothetical protein ABL78_3482 [Leptomonas seymouri]|uniref:BAR domain-containing protein n=1 Tax=Leptomonas seymouri TaxID=5684 RepID=A0A0N1PCG3_LEPSE|nr:hypothetical protein ABL78_3482 [Leptomonas seymouri]|eukprot:KPI87451.1 hypothetical protein ABL78_3482 [Leptomonas seymouri]
MPRSDPSDEDSVLIKKLKHACSTYETASKKYLSAVKELDSSMESIAIAIRELAQGEENVTLRDKADRLCSSVDRHMAGRSVGYGDSNKPRRESNKNGESIVDPDEYPFVTYMNDFTREISVAIDELRDTVKSTEKAKLALSDMTSKYNKKRTAVDDMEMKLAKKNQGISDNAKFKEKVAERDEARIKLDAETERFNTAYNGLLLKRNRTLQRVIDGFHKYTAKYYDTLAKVVRT